MAAAITHREVMLLPAYGLMTIRDASDTMPIDGDQVRGAGPDAMVTGNGRELYVLCAQTLLQVLLRIELWDGAPVPRSSPGGGWSAPQRLRLACPSGHVHVGSPTGPVHP